jgi:Fic family protein
MKWNWQQKDWPYFNYNNNKLIELETSFIYSAGIQCGTYKYIENNDKELLTIELISEEALKTSEIEGEYLNRESVQSSIRRNFGLIAHKRKVSPAEQGIADMMVDLYLNYASPLTENLLFSWHTMITNGRRDLMNIGSYRTHEEPMQVISGPLHKPKIHFEAPPSKNVAKEMNSFIKWFQETGPNTKTSLSPLIRAGIAHLYFVSIHPFEDGNGRIACALAEKALSQSLRQPVIIALSSVIQKNKKQYYDMLEASNKANEITDWLEYFANTILEAQQYTQRKINFLIEKTKLYDRIRGQLNQRQEKVLARIFIEGIEGFKGGLSAENYISITGTSRATATRDLQELVEKRVLLRVGELKSTRYHLNISLS